MPLMREMDSIDPDQPLMIQNLNAWTFLALRVTLWPVYNSGFSSIVLWWQKHDFINYSKYSHWLLFASRPEETISGSPDDCQSFSTGFTTCSWHKLFLAIYVIVKHQALSAILWSPHRGPKYGGGSSFQRAQALQWYNRQIPSLTEEL